MNKNFSLKQLNVNIFKKSKNFWEEFNDLIAEIEKSERVIKKVVETNFEVIFDKKERKLAEESVNNIVNSIGKVRIIRKSYGLIFKLDNLSRVIHFFDSVLINKIAKSIDLRDWGYDKSHVVHLMKSELSNEDYEYHAVLILIDELISSLTKSRKILENSTKLSDAEFLKSINNYLNNSVIKKVKSFKSKIAILNKDLKLKLSNEEKLISSRNQIYKLAYLSFALYMILLDLTMPVFNDPKLDDGKGFGVILGVPVFMIFFNRELRDSIIDSVRNLKKFL